MPKIGYSTPQKIRYQMPIEERQPKSHELIRTRSSVLLSKTLNINEKDYTVKIEEGVIDTKNTPLSVRIQKDRQRIFTRNSPTLTPTKKSWAGSYTGSGTGHCMGYVEPGSKSTLKSIYARDRVRFIRVSGTFIASPQITSDNKAEELKKLLIQLNQSSTVSETPQFNTPDLHFTRYLENLGYDVYLGQDNDDDETEIECILLKPKKFICEDIATVNVSKHGEPQIHWINQRTEEFTLKTAINYLITQDNNKNDSDSINSESDQGSTSGESCSSDRSISSQESSSESPSDDESYSLNSLSTLPSDDDSSDDEMERLVFSRNPKDLINFEAIGKEKSLRQSPTTVAVHL
tara:strand:+ start:211 stop:1254 length:1044 start_codon:yes stop_codon:yes gene_type:complete